MSYFARAACTPAGVRNIKITRGSGTLGEMGRHERTNEQARDRQRGEGTKPKAAQQYTDDGEEYTGIQNECLPAK